MKQVVINPDSGPEYDVGTILIDENALLLNVEFVGIFQRIADAIEALVDETRERNRMLGDWIEFRKDMTPLTFVDPDKQDS